MHLAVDVQQRDKCGTGGAVPQTEPLHPLADQVVGLAYGVGLGPSGCGPVCRALCLGLSRRLGPTSILDQPITQRLALLVSESLVALA